MPARRAVRTAETIASSSVLPANRRSIRPSADATPSTRARPYWNSVSSILPSSNPNSSSRASGFARKTPASALGSSPSALQNALKEASRLLVITPPQSTSSPRRDSAPIRHVFCPAGELEHALAERLEVRIVGAARDRALVVALHEHHRLPHRERGVPAQLSHRASGALLVARDQLGASGKAVASRDCAERLSQAALGVAGL